MIFNFHENYLISHLENEKVFKIINLFSQKLEALDFILSTTSQDCRNLQELAGEVHGGNNQNFVSIEDLLTVEIIVENFETILNEINGEKKNNKKIIIDNLKNRFEEEEIDNFKNESEDDLKNGSEEEDIDMFENRFKVDNFKNKPVKKLNSDSENEYEVEADIDDSENSSEKEEIDKVKNKPDEEEEKNYLKKRFEEKIIDKTLNEPNDEEKNDSKSESKEEEIDGLKNRFEEVDINKIIFDNLKNQFEEEEIKKFIDKYQQFKEFFSENLDKSKFTAEVIQKILNKSEFLIINSNINNFNAFYKNDIDKDNIFQNLNYEYLIYLRDRALTRTKINDSLLNMENEKQNKFAKSIIEEEEIIFQNNKMFVKSVHQINELLKLLNNLIQKGFVFNFEKIENKNNIDGNEINKKENIISKINKIDDPLLLKIKMTIERNSENNHLNSDYEINYFLNDNEIKSFKELYEMIHNIYINIMNIQKDAYLKKNYIKYIYGKQFQLFFDYFYNHRKSENLYYFLCYFLNKEKIEMPKAPNIDNKKKKSKFSLKEDLNMKFYEDFIKNSEIFLDETLKKNNINLELILEQNKLKKDFIKYKGIYLNGCNSVERDIVIWYKYLTNNLPLAQNLLLCKQDTSSEEIISFLYRAILCNHHICFCLARTDLLSLDKKNIILDIINELLNGGIGEKKNMNSCLLIMNNNLDDELCKSLFRIKFIKPFDIPYNVLKDIKIYGKNEDNNIMVIHSDYSGVGKSTYIKNKAKDYIYIPIGGIFNKENALKRLLDLDKEQNINDKKNLLIHADLYETSQKTLMNDFLYFILITKLYGENNNLFYLSKTIKIYLEIPNSFISFLDKYPLLKLFPEKKLFLNKLEPLIVPDDICSNIKIVSLYLKLLKEENVLPENTNKNFKSDNKVNKNAIVFPFTPPSLILKDEIFDYNKIVIKAEDENKYLTRELCQKLIFDEIKKTIPYPTYYQITTFINVLADQLVRFNRNFFLSACTILDSGRFNSCSLRSLIIRNFINLTKYFTKGAFTEILNEQKDILTLMNQKYTEKEKINKANNIFENCIHESISFRNMDLALIFFYGGDNSNYFSIITNKSPNDKTYIDLMKLKNFQSGEDIAKRVKTTKSKEIKKDEKGKVKEKEEEIKIYEKIEKLNDYMNYTQEQFLGELKDILDVKNPIKNEIDEENKKDDKKDKTQTKDNKEAKNQTKNENKNEITDENKKDDENDKKKLKNALDVKNQIKNENKNEIIEENKKDNENDKIQLKNQTEMKNPIQNENKNEIDSKNKKDNNEEDKKLSLTEITKDYVFTADNFIKMCLILIRLRANIPVIMMGETGCGKTSLIRKLSELQNNGKCVLVIDNIHAGHTNEDIISFIEEKVIPKANELAESQKEKILDYKKNDFIYEEKKLWVFFDELNTCNSMDLLSEIICKHSCQGKVLPKNIFFIGAVNPYRKAKQKRVGLKISNINDTYDENDLVYTVNPMPHSLLNFVFNFGSLNADDEKKYIQNMVETAIFDLKLSQLTTELTAEAQNFIREQNDVSSVSLREIRRFIIFYQFFLEYLKIRKEIIIEEKVDEKNNDIKYSEFTDFDIKLYSINLSIYLGYYLRLNDNENQDDENIIINDNKKNEGGLRNILYEKINKIFKKESKYDFLIIPEREENFIADNVKLEKGIAKNRALLENLFSLFVAINTKIPIFIIGKPGCSKTLSVQLINNAMKGSISTNSFFQKYPKMYVSTYQGALNSTSEGVKAIFEKAREILKVKENKSRISTIYFDEMGLAEHSPHNPLKVIHSELEYDLNEDDKKISFLGVSNWMLDASKMNRGITVTIPDPNENDIKKTSITIAKSYLDEELDNNIKLFFENLGMSFYEYKQEFIKKKILKKYLDFHGNRDFYHMIKYPSTKIREALNQNKIIDNNFLSNLAIKGLERNFGGLILDENKYTNGINLIIEKLSKYNNEVKNIKYENENNSIINTKENVMNNLIEHSNNYLSRYLLLITRSNIGIYLISSFLKSINGKNNDYNNYTILLGSLFIDDIEKEEYTTKILSKIKMNIEKDTILILKDFESIYSSLYDLFNQNFVEVRGKKYARIALGSKTNSFSEVNNNFRCIITIPKVMKIMALLLIRIK